ncbi:MAG: hypothetical protein A3D93_02160 [Acidobacteria bacterium RIFCSPHIGHO2_12_FULL_67_30]|nr:MAG: hypothetical protein A3B65_01620 [Acidobacteria bacterium RIFCSPHIGHO2_02_FULL_67_57]OFV85255.1 MAG: hypothetical protein A2620_04145 [Acidobacteria bacterium RIFCSPHIGHO2_01_FULL_67_28]OFV87571.1 MAG: hypothetical protein A3D93_02160 [Acidobacteria bacterium RIFCSPHIGHO2_12_FULL_67_30]
MLLSVSVVFVMLVAWLAVTALLIVLAIVRAVISLREEDQLYIDPGEEKLLAEQREIVAKLDRLRPYLIGSLVASVVLGLATFGLWVYRQLTTAG